MARPPHTRHPVDAPLVDHKRRVELKELARKKREDELRKQQEDALLAQYEQEVREELEPDEELRPCTINLPPTSDRIAHDGVVYLHGGTYQFGKAKYDTVMEVMQRAWGHEFEIEGKTMERYRRPRGIHLRPGDDQRTTSQMIRM